MQHEYIVEGMHCRSCVAKIEQALTEADGVQSATVTLSPPRAEVVMSEHVATERLNEAVASRGDYQLKESHDKTDQDPAAETATQQPPESLYPLFLIVAFIAGVVVLIAAAGGAFELGTMMRHFMAGFFIVFAFFKLLDPPGFVSAYRGYDLLARRSEAWAWAYPYVELGLGVAYLLNFAPVVTNTVTLVLMLVGAAGVLRAILDKRAIRCACLGTALNLPMTKVTLVEDLAMAAMAAGMLAMMA